MDKRNFWDREEVAARIKQMHYLGSDISYAGVLESTPQLLFAAVHYYRNWAIAVTSAGIDYNRVRRQESWDRNKIKKLLKKHKNSGEGFRYNGFEKRHPKLFHAAVYHFGGWANALTAIGMDYNKVKRFTAWDRGKIKRRIIALYKKNKDISYKVMRRTGRINLISAANYHFGGWGKAVSACGLDYDRIRKK
jgi:hypothetical protein